MSGRAVIERKKKKTRLKREEKKMSGRRVKKKGKIIVKAEKDKNSHGAQDLCVVWGKKLKINSEKKKKERKIEAREREGV